MEADVVLLADQLAAVFEGELTESGLDLTCLWDWEVETDFDTFTGRRLTVLPLGYRPIQPASRRDNNIFDAMLSIIVTERYKEEPRPPRVPKEWVSERVFWVQENVFNPISSIADPLKLGIYANSVDLSEWWSQFAEVTEVANIDWLTENKVFWSEIEVTFRRVK